MNSCTGGDAAYWVPAHCDRARRCCLSSILCYSDVPPHFVKEAGQGVLCVVDATLVHAHCTGSVQGMVLMWLNVGCSLHMPSGEKYARMFV